MPVITLGEYNTISISAASGVYRINPAGVGSYKIDLLNIGPGAIFLRADADPVVNGQNSLQLPANMGQNDLSVSSGVGLGVIAAADTTISVRVK